METKLSSLNILLIEDSPGDAKLVRHRLRAPAADSFTGELQLDHEETLSAGIDALESEVYDLLFLDLNLPDASGLNTLDRVLDEEPNIPIVVLTGIEDRDAAVEAIKHGAQDYLPKPQMDADRLARSLRYAVERYRQEQELRRQNQRLERFASMVSHDLRSPLNVAMNRTVLAQDHCDSDHLDHATGALNRMAAIVDDLLALTLHGQRVEDTEPVGLSDVVNECWTLLESDGAELNVESDFTFLASVDRLRELLENLFRNAIDHSDGPTRIFVGALDDTPGFYVADDGPGIPEETREMVFEFGYSTADEGTGIGLAIIKEIADAHGWTCTVTDSDSGGARFEFYNVQAVDNYREETK